MADVEGDEAAEVRRRGSSPPARFRHGPHARQTPPAHSTSEQLHVYGALPIRAGV